MDVYEAPKANVEVATETEYSPIKAIIFGLSVSVLFSFVVSMVEGVVFALSYGIDLASESEYNEVLSNDIVFLLTDLLITFVVLYFAGRVVRKYVPGRAYFYGTIVAAITFAVFLPLFLVSNSFEIYPIWYNTLSLFSVFVAILLGARPKDEL